MLQNYLKIAVRSLLKNRFFTLINLLGLSLSMGAALLIFLYTSHELTYDTFHSKSDRVFQVKGKMNYGGMEMQMSGMSSMFGPRVTEEDPRVQNSVRMINPGKTIIKNEQDEAWFVENAHFVDPSFSEVFDFEFTRGNPKELGQPGKVFLTPTMASQYFGTHDPLGKTLYYDRKYPLTVAGIVAEALSNSSIRYDMLISFQTLETIDEMKGTLDNENVSLGSFLTYLELDEPSSKAQVEESIEKIAMESADESYVLDSMEDVYLGGNDVFSPMRIYLFALLAIGLLIVVLALINYINLAIARSTARSKEVGIRKVNGASKRSLVFQFFLDSFLIISIAFTLSLILLMYVRPYMISFLDKPLDIEYLQTPIFVGIVAAIFIGSVILAGSYPAWIMARFNPVSIIKSNRTGGGKNSFLQKSFTTFQFMVSIGLLLATLVIIDQLKFMKSQEIGLDKDQVLAINLSPNKQPVGFEYMKNQIKDMPGISGVALSSLSLFKGGYSIYFTTVPDTDEQISLSVMNVDEQFAELMGIEFEHRFEEVPLRGNLLANETAAGRLHISTDSLSKEMAIGPSVARIAGITKDFNYSSLKNEIQPMVMEVHSDTSRTMIEYGGSLYVKIQEGTDVKEALAGIQAEVDKFQPDAPFDYYFLDEAFNNLYKSEERMATMLSGFTFLAILIAAMGLLGMITFTLERRVREIGIRKVLGASGRRIMLMVMGEYFVIFVVSALLAVPAAWWVMENWLTSFTYRIDIGASQAILAITLALLVGFGTIGLRTWRASRANPADSLRTE
ncbi:ABC transporter permease [Fulvivirga sedimenti]|uniref:ABC transporter permease n=1 Tax=Fulvivirga sedimenti TaxID=2879465 RepID=A0A9X1KYG3_9BACT|nr:ABC transporter permease [Fulvivirga sedimenti]MCA6075593.1 ABC transporter permease [Fulvivirga sedimenti]MCA6076770.1 ABC transporter permease [Fulvivirga sedimenti]MCA6077898.1 ABC transporter permease [Fulvivirga sedimenti]